jgi:hypothetical protein
VVFPSTSAQGNAFNLYTFSLFFFLLKPEGLFIFDSFLIFTGIHDLTAFGTLIKKLQKITTTALGDPSRFKG